MSKFVLEEFYDSSDDSLEDPEDIKEDGPTQPLKSLWIEKYRPKTIDDLIIDQGTKNKINKIIENKSMPNIIITGDPGIGKTTTVQCIARKLLGPYYSKGILETNASDNRGIKSVSDLVTEFCKQRLEVKKEHKGVYARHKIVLLDEVDNMTPKAQQLISSLMEQYPHSIKFALTCNNSSDIIRAIQSRCNLLRYKKIDHDNVIKRLRYVCEKEGVNYDEEGLKCIVNISQGDLRHALNNLQSCSNGYDIVNEENIFKICDKPHPLVIDRIIEACDKHEFKQALEHLESLRNKGYSNTDISMGLVNARTKLSSESKRIKFLREIGKTSYMISKNKGNSSPVALTGCLAALCNITV